MASSPLAAARVWVTRPRAADGELPRVLEQAGARVICAPTIAIDDAVDRSALDRLWRSLAAVDWIVFTSVRAVDALAEPRLAPGVDRAMLASRQIAAVGPVTARALQRHGITPAIVAEPHSAAGLLAALAPRLRPGSMVCYPRAAAVSSTLIDGLRRTGAQVIDVIAYRTATVPVGVESARLLRDGVDCVAFCSPSAIRGAAPYRRAIANAVVACIGPTTAQAAYAEGLSVDVLAPRATTRALADAIVAHFAYGDR